MHKIEREMALNIKIEIDRFPRLFDNCNKSALLSWPVAMKCHVNDVRIRNGRQNAL
jgi:hypothetical protein